MNQDTNGLQSSGLSATGEGLFHLHVELFSQRDLGGTQTGELDAWVDVGLQSRFRTAVGLDVASLTVNPQQISLEVQHSKQFYATPYNSGAQAVFTELGSLSWTTLGGTASVNENGLVLGESEGQGSVRATYVPQAINGSAVFTVTPFTATRTKWTVIVYLNAANDLYTFSDLNVNQIEKVANNDQVRFVIQWKQSKDIYPQSSFDGTRRYLVKFNTSTAIASELLQDMGTGVDMGRPETMLGFINWAKTYYPADRYCLVIWNHGNGWRRGLEEPSRAVSYDDQTGNSIQISELAQALGDTRFDIVAWDASLMQMLEVAYEIQDHAQFVAGSEESPPGEGYPYDLIFREFRDRDSESTKNLSKAFVDGMLAVPSYASRKITQSVIDTAKLPALASAADALGTQLSANVATIGQQIISIRSTSQSYSPTASRVYRDLDHVCDLINQQIGIPSVQLAATNVRSALANAVVWEGHNANSPNSHGVSVDFSSATTFNSGTTGLDYSLMRFAAETSWNEWLLIAP
ncbi:MAG: hypothetical protein HZC36_05575 [Armatimonadetes bacterium]|nr:hypothetical protein [Armatimonadota bacterium]